MCVTWCVRAHLVNNLLFTVTVFDTFQIVSVRWNTQKMHYICAKKILFHINFEPQNSEQRYYVAGSI